ncbi:bifunctional hydroxymethylpyrimidine kinase/phosphomethylpyrimidine kinase [Halosimplex pelagicum]|uniref:Bifunctional hydroxymethylpyrimidine kinase/phosphomethylpyrimidine kinase n=1 Tax=Halosimplex pelagicum TaxID=869886 RepID=A0A7D5PCX1_9EURY|nr:bifunctional hydroxymethylpyrimidine kinase/phosphomethylpyrimidine kinase [Halosimplex pelagicum]QLH82678.1 bifunctional hydroxymethylpyrimidine kinase/phosphomethylpyrimidine kinase [Halosimplex pelagicum]
MTRRDAPVSPPVVLTIAGSDSGGGAGIQADLKTIEAGGGFGTTAITSVTAQNTTGVERTHVLPTGEIDAQCDAVLSDFDVAAVKTGMLATADVVELVTDRVRETAAPAVVDPVMVAASGDRLLASEAESAYEDLIAEATIVTPNADEAAVLTGIDPADESEAREAGERLVETGADAALVKGGHIAGGDSADVVDVLVTSDSVETFRHPRVDTDATHGSGCTLSSAVATRLAHGDDVESAVAAGVDLLARAVRYNLDVGEGPGAVHHAVELRDRAARDDTAEAVEGVVRAFVDRNIGPLVPEVGTNVAGATPYAERPGETAAVEGRVTRTRSGVEPTRGVRFGASTHVARLLLAAREHDPDLRFAANLRYDDAVASALADLNGPVAEFDPADDRADSVEWGVETAFDAVDGTPAAVVDRGSYGNEPIAFVLARTPDALVDRTLATLDAVEVADE